MIRCSIDRVMNPAGQREPGLVHGQVDAEYREVCRMNPSSLAAGLLDGGEVDPAAIRLEFESGERSRAPAQQDKLDRGTLGHLAILQPELIANRVAIWTGGRRQYAEWDKFKDENKSKLILRREDYDEVMFAANRAMEVPKVRALFAGLETEVGIYSEDGTGKDRMFLRGRCDGIKQDGEFVRIVDLKTTEAGIDAHSVSRTIRDFCYREKMAMYRRMFCAATKADPDFVTCHLAFLRLSQPIAIRILRISTAALQWGEWRMERAMNSVRDCIRSGNWPVYVSDGIEDVADWELPEEEEVEVEYD